ncbi:Hypothetical protein AKI40_2457 [Enterobacter sp. FY-07]|uniref:DUF1482 family protein n=1 Tax=Kosakonia oryzendophytica TaxID=1005665 RepID=UPI000776C1DE|nr:DUF1482 family protein [Kosakonia oryzendophytica]AMO48855.1 Hypothetical protein AKI40_2457 [Enterobacter sp. FY-07]WBT56638.1 DUF1482 family protein [Kosakonia oryzendophytica]
MSSLFYLVITVCAIIGECFDTPIGIYQTKAECYAAAAEQHVKGECLPYRRTADDQQPAVRF